VIFIDEVELFAVELAKLAEKYKLKNLQKYCQKMRQLIVEYKINDLKILIKSFEEILESLRG